MLKSLFFAGAPHILNTAPDVHRLVELLADMDHQWFQIEDALCVPYNVLSDLQASQEANIVTLRHVIHTWQAFQPSPVTWGTVISAIEGMIVKNVTKANEIRAYLHLPRRQ